MTTNIKEAIGLILTGATIIAVTYILLLKQNYVKHEILTFRANEKVLATEKEPLDRVIGKHRLAYKTQDELIPNKVMASLDTLYQKTIILAINIEKARAQIKLYESTVDWLNIILAMLFIAAFSCFSLGVIRSLK